MADGPLPVEGVDYAWSRPDIAGLAAAEKRFACRYGGPGSDGKQLDPVEAQALSAAGVAIVANAEGSADGLLGGWNAGVAWARDAEAHFAACGMPAGRPIYFSVDFDVASGQWATVANALRGAASVLGGVHRVGVYGSFDAMVWARRDAVAQWFWQTYAWSERRWAAGNHIEQYLNGVSLAGATLDLDRALQGDFGQWMVGGSDVDEYEHALLEDMAYREDADAAGSPTIRGGRFAGEPFAPVVQRDRLEAKLAAVAADVAELKARPPAPPAVVDLDALVAKLEPVIRDAVADGLEGGSAAVRADAE